MLSRAAGCAKSWQAQHFGDAVAEYSVHLGVCLCGRGSIRQLSRGTGCCRARGGGRAKLWQAQHFGILWRCRCLCRGRRCILCIWVWRCHCRSRGRRSILCIWVRVCVAGQAQHSVHLGVRLCGRGSIWQLSKRTGWRCALGGGRAKSWQARHFGDAISEVLAGAAFCASGCVFVWQGQHFVIHSLAFILTLTHTSRMSKGSSTRLV